MYGSITQILITAFVEQNVFPKNDRWVRTRWMIHGFLMLLVSWFVFPGISSQAATVTFWTMIPAIYYMAGKIPNSTPLGSRYAEACLGFKRFLTVTEIMRLKTTDHPSLPPETISRMLPYAIALGIEQDWQKAIPYFAISLPNPLS